MKKILFLLTFGIFTLYARDVIDNSGNCLINWTQGKVVCSSESESGQSKYAAQLAAKIIVQRDLLGVIKGIKIDSLITVEDGLLSSDIIKARVIGVIRGAQITSNVYNKKDGYAVATAELQMGKDILAALLSDPTKLSWNEKVKQLWDNFNIIATANASIYSNKDRETIIKLLTDLRKNGDLKSSQYLENILKNINDKKYSGILIDVSNISDFQKAMMVRLVDKQGKEIYPADLLSRATLLKRNTSVGFMYGLKDARKNKRVFSKPIEFKAQKVYKNRKSNIVLNDKQIKAIKSLDEDILHRAKIILVLGE